MPCIKCNSDFNLFNWKMKCGECEEKFCASCLRRREGLFYCETCITLLKRPPDRGKLMELKSKDLQEYLKRHNISTHGLVEKQELVDLFCSRPIPIKQKKSTDIFTTNLAYSLQNLRENPALGKFLGSENFFATSGRHQASPSNSQESPNAPRPPPRRRSPRNSPTSTSAQFQPSSSSSSQSSSGNIPPGGNRESPSTSFDNTLGSEWVYVNPEETLDNISQPKTPEGSPLLRKCPKLSEITSEADLSKLTAKQLKVLLTLNRVDYKGCVEKTELLEKAAILWRESRKQEKELPENLEDLCKLCMDAPLECVLLECGHIATCVECGKKLAECPICRQYVSRVVRTFKA
ncbi:E3 ubiquitin-protein ligase RNF34 [Coccinella septempunctata]|uniref:E3 ubiquitin-protein ligase RNF34 n=1 Tax=Coccinella septempunctata TaxID=41139 RepID=UPI001D08205D|nr:E3 ubiquitin-protein ligase RNF34 [Coccinella septempunctata]